MTIGLIMGLLCVTSSALAQGGLDQRVSELSQQIAGKMSAKQKTTVAVVEFTDLQGNVNDFGRFLAEELVTRLGNLERFKVIERQLLTKIITEQKLSLTGVIDPASAKQLGKVLGVDAVVSGTLTNLAQNIRVNARLISTETGEVFAVAAADIFKDESVTALLSGTGSPQKNPGAAPVNQPQKVPNPRAVVDDFVFEIETCKPSTTKIVCWLTIKNDSTVDREMSIYGRDYASGTRSIDELGNQYPVEGFGFSGSQGSTEYVNQVLVSQVKTRAWIRFVDVSDQARKLTISIRIWSSSSHRYYSVTLREVQLAR